MKQRIEKELNENKSWFFAKINKIEKPLARSTKKKTEKTQSTTIRNERRLCCTPETNKHNIVNELYLKRKKGCSSSGPLEVYNEKY